MDAIVRDDRAQFKKFASALHRVRELRVDSHREHGLDPELRAEVVLFESGKSAERSRVDTHHDWYE